MRKIIDWFKYFGWGWKFPLNYMSAIFHPIKFFKCLKYPFLKEYHKWTGKFMGYAYTEDEDIPFGWYKAFGKDLIKDIAKAGKASRKRLHKHLSWRKMITWEQIKEKYGTLRLYASATEEIEHVLEKYELLSQFYCINCGKPSTYRTKGWIEFYCEDCFIKDLHRFGRKVTKKMEKAQLKDCRLTKEDIPSLRRYDKISEKWVDVDLLKEYNIDIEQLVKDRPEK